MGLDKYFWLRDVAFGGEMTVPEEMRGAMLVVDDIVTRLAKVLVHDVVIRSLVIEDSVIGG